MRIIRNSRRPALSFGRSMRMSLRRSPDGGRGLRFRAAPATAMATPRVPTIGRRRGGVQQYPDQSRHRDRAGDADSADLSRRPYRASTNRAENQVLAQRARLIAQEQSTFTDTINAYVGVIQAQQLLTLNINNERLLARQLQATNDRFRVGEITRTDVAQAEAALAGATGTARPPRGISQRRGRPISGSSAICHPAIWSSRSRLSFQSATNRRL